MVFIKYLKLTHYDSNGYGYYCSLQRLVDKYKHFLELVILNKHQIIT